MIFVPFKRSVSLVLSRDRRPPCGFAVCELRATSQAAPSLSVFSCEIDCWTKIRLRVLEDLDWPVEDA